MARLGIISPFPPGQPGGVSTFVRNVRDELIGSGHECKILTPTYPIASLSRRPILTLMSLAMVFVRLVRLRPSALFVQAHPIFLIPPLAYRWLSRRTAVVFTFHTAPDAEALSSVKAGMIATLVNRSDAVTFVSHHLQREVESVVPLKPAVPRHVVYPGVRRT